MSIIGFEQIPGIAVLPICSILVPLESITLKSFSFSVFKDRFPDGIIFFQFNLH